MMVKIGAISLVISYRIAGLMLFGLAAFCGFRFFSYFSISLFVMIISVCCLDSFLENGLEGFLFKISFIDGTCSAS